jgi:hypothetical protein
MVSRYLLYFLGYQKKPLMKIIFFFNFFSLNDRFIISEFLIKSIKLPKCLILVAFYTKKCMFWKSVEKAKDSKVRPVKFFKEVALRSLTSSLENQNKKSDSESDTKQKMAETNRFSLGIKFADLEQPENANETKKEKESQEKDANVAALNFLAFTALFLLIIICDMIIWISIGY